jgi:hypothetical protein
MFFMHIMKHSPETCPVFEPKYRKTAIYWAENIESITAKYGVKLVGAWIDHPGHTVYAVYEAPKMDAIMGMMRDPDLMAGLAFNTSEIKVVLTQKEILPLLKK